MLHTRKKDKKKLKKPKKKKQKKYKKTEKYNIIFNILTLWIYDE